jgi:hypothetical protein
MLWIFSFARSGSTLLLNFLADGLGYCPIFEPFMQKPDKIGENCDFEKVHDWFRGAPQKNLLHQYKLGSYYLGHIPTQEFNSPKVKPYKDLLSNYIRNIYQEYGPNTVVKCVRQQGNIIFIQHLLKALNIDAQFIFLKREPFEIAFSYYRNGGFHRRSTWNVNQVFQYRKCMYSGDSQDLDSLFKRVGNSFENLIAAIIADYVSFDKTGQFFEKNSVRFLPIWYEDFISEPMGCLRDVAQMLGLSLSGKNLEMAKKKYQFNPSKLRSGASDPIFHYIAKRTRKKLSPWLEKFPEISAQEKGKMNVVHLKCLLKNVLPFIKVS